MHTARRFARLGIAGAAAVALAAVAVPLGTAAKTHPKPPPPPPPAPSPFAVGIPTVVDPIRGAGEPDMVVDGSNNALITGPGGSGTQTSFFWRTRDGGLSYPLLGPSQGHWLCPASGGGDSLVVQDPRTGDMYLTDQEALADIGSAKLGGTGGFSSKCASAPGATADRPFEAVLDSSTAPQGRAAGKPLLYLSWLCQGCRGAGGKMPPAGGLAFGWSDDGVTFHEAEPTTLPDTPATGTLVGGGSISGFSWHGNMVTDPATGYVYTALSSGNNVGVVVGAPPATPNPGNVGQLASLTFHVAANAGEPTSLFPVIGMDRNGTLYEAYITGDGAATTTDPLPAGAWHLYYTYSTDAPLHQHWSAPVQVDHGTATQTSDFGWMAVGDPGKLGFVWLGTDRREHPSFQDTTNLRQWHPFMAVTTDAFDAAPVFQQQEVGRGPNHINDMCLQGTVGCITSDGNRNMADFISCDIGPDGALQAVWANDSNQLATLPTTMIPGLPLTETVRQVSGPRLIGTGYVDDSRFSTTPRVSMQDRAGDALYPVDPGQGAQTEQPQLDLTSSSVRWDGSNVVVHMSAANLATTASPALSQPNVWYLTTWQMNHTIYFARAQSTAGGALSFAAGAAKSFDRVGLNGQTVATLVDYSGGSAVQGTRQGNDISITVPAADVGNPTVGSPLEVVTAYTALDSGAPLFVGPGGGNIPTLTDATPAYDTVLGLTGNPATGDGGGDGFKGPDVAQGAEHAAEQAGNHPAGPLPTASPSPGGALDAQATAAAAGGAVPTLGGIAVLLGAGAVAVTRRRRRRR